MDENNVLAVETRIASGYPAHYGEFARQDAAIKAGNRLIEDLKQRKGMAVAYRLSEETDTDWHSSWPDRPPDELYRLRVERLTVLYEKVESVSLASLVEIPMRSETLRLTGTKVILQELLRRLRCWLDSHQECSYVRPASDYPPESVFLDWKE